MVYDMLGREVARFVDTPLAAGAYTVDFKAEGLAAGVYTYHLRVGPFSRIRSMVLTR